MVLKVEMTYKEIAPPGYGSMEKLQAEFKKYFRIFSDKGAVRLASSQRMADAAYRKIAMILTDAERHVIGVARSRALQSNEGRAEFDNICKRIMQRMLR